MSYAQDTIISANASNVLALALDALLIDAGWTIVETLDPAGTNSPRTRVYQSSGADNQCGYDWYVAIMWKQLGTESWMQIISGGAYDQPTHIMTQIPAAMSHTSSSAYADGVTGDQWGGFNVNVATVASGLVAPLGTSRGTSADRPWFTTTIQSSAFGYWASITLDHVSLFTTIASVNGPPNFFASTLDVSPEWAALDVPGAFGNGVALNPVICIIGDSTSAASGVRGTTTGVSVSIKGSLNTAPIVASQRIAGNVGAILPVLDGPWLPAYAWRSAFYLAASSVSDATNTNPIWDFPLFGDGFHIGDGIDYYQVRGGAIGDTVEIEGATYVLSGPFGPGTNKATIAVLVEV